MSWESTSSHGFSSFLLFCSHKIFIPVVLVSCLSPASLAPGKACRSQRFHTFHKPQLSCRSIAFQKKQPSLEEQIRLAPRFLDFPRGKYFRGDRSQDSRHFTEHPPVSILSA